MPYFEVLNCKETYVCKDENRYNEPELNYSFQVFQNQIDNRCKKLPIKIRINLFKYNYVPRQYVQ